MHWQLPLARMPFVLFDEGVLSDKNIKKRERAMFNVGWGFFFFKINRKEDILLLKGMHHEVNGVVQNSQKNPK